MVDLPLFSEKVNKETTMANFKFGVGETSVALLSREAARIVNKVDGLGNDAFVSRPIGEGSQSGPIGVVANHWNAKWALTVTGRKLYRTSIPLLPVYLLGF